MLPAMCGIFAYMGHQPILVTQAIQVLSILETEQEPSEPTPVGGHGEGIAYLKQKREFTLVKVGKTTKRSPAHDLKQQLPNPATIQSRIILGHVRRASPEFIDTIQYAECTQPYKPCCTCKLTDHIHQNPHRNQLPKNHTHNTQRLCKPRSPLQPRPQPATTCQ